MGAIVMLLCALFETAQKDNSLSLKESTHALCVSVCSRVSRV